tara:strand:+ start:2269 stop:2787 length:519 start_codon:yes stop_codon:yes gene_type:complete
MSLGDATQKIIGDTVQTVAEQANEIVQASSAQAAYDKALTLGEQIANYTCKELKDQIPPMITSTTNEIIKQLTAKIDSERFTDDFINVLQTKLLDANSPYSEKFLTKFDELFDRIINDAEKRRDKKEYEKENEKKNGEGPSFGNGRRKHSKKKRNQKKPTKQTKRVRFSTKK